MQSNGAPTSMEVEVAGPPKPLFEPLKAHEMSDGQVQFRKVAVPPHRCLPLKKVWMDIYTPLNEQMKIDIRKTRADTPDVNNLQKCAGFVQAFMLGFDVMDARILFQALS